MTRSEFSWLMLQVLLTELQFLPTKIDASEEELILASEFLCSIRCNIYLSVSMCNMFDLFNIFQEVV